MTATFDAAAWAEKAAISPNGDKPRSELQRVDWRELWDDTTEEEWIIEPVLPARRLVAIYSAPKTGKSLLMLEIAAAISCGKEVLGDTPQRPYRVLYVDFENDLRGDIKIRLQDMHYQPSDLGNLDYLSFPALSALDSAQGAAELLQAATEWGDEVVVIDTVSRSVKGEENSNDTWNQFYRHTGMALKRAGIAMVRLDHTGKDESKGQRGGSAKSGDVDAVWKLSTIVKDKTYQLELDVARLKIDEKKLILHREEDPLRHRVDARGGIGAFDTTIQAVIDVLNTEFGDSNVGERKAREALRKHDQKASNNALRAALERRREQIHLLISDDVAADGPATFGDGE